MTGGKCFPLFKKKKSLTPRKGESENFDRNDNEETMKPLLNSKKGY